MTFTQWLRTQRERHDPVGDFARDWLSDRDKPRAPTWSAVRAHLVACNACREARVAAAHAYREYRQTEGR